MRVGWFLSVLAAASLLGGVPSPAAAQSADEYADSWTEARRGDRDWTERATEQLTTGPADRIFGRAAQGTMDDIVKVVIQRVEGMRGQPMQACPRAALEQAFGQTIVSGRKAVMSGAGGSLLTALGGATGAAGVGEFLGQRLVQQVGQKLRDQALDQFKKQMRDRMKAGSPEFFEDSDSRGQCTTQFRVVWDKSSERYYFLFAGDCQCDRVSCEPLSGRTARLRRWTIEGWGTVIPDITQAANGEKRVRFMIGAPQEVSLTADCCGEGDHRFMTQPANGAGNEWVGFVRQPPATPSREPTPAGGSSGSTSTPAQPPATTPPPAAPPRPARPPRVAPIEIPVIPDGPLTDAQWEDLENRVFGAEERSQAAREDAYRRLAALRDNPAATPEQIAEAAAAEEAAADLHRRARAARMRMSEKQKQQALQEQQQQQQQQEQSSMVVPLDAVAARILAVHNRERSEVGVPSLHWDPRLAASASAYAQQLARGGPFVHAPRAGRENERENLSRGLRGASPEEMMLNWTQEKSNFMPGTYPNISKTGSWYDVSHYSQMIWRATTSVGCGVVTGQSEILVCRYSPPGNQDGRRVP